MKAQSQQSELGKSQLKNMIITNFKKISFHDASVEKFSRVQEWISIEFEDAFMNKDHSRSNDEDWFVDSGLLHICNVTSESPLFQYDNVEGKQHPELELPIEEIMNLEFNGNVFEFGGFLKNEPWLQKALKCNCVQN